MNDPTLDPDFFHPDYHLTREGKRVYLSDFKADDVDIRTIARRLAGLNRWRADTIYPVSVAGHSLLMFDEAGRRGYNIDVQKAVLLHDAHEAYCVDVPSDIKRLPMMAGYRELCDRIQLVIEEKYDIRCGPEVKELDRWAAAVECRECLFPAACGVYYPPRMPHHDEGRFLSVAHSLSLK